MSVIKREKNKSNKNVGNNLKSTFNMDNIEEKVTLESEEEQPTKKIQLELDLGSTESNDSKTAVPLEADGTFAPLETSKTAVATDKGLPEIESVDESNVKPETLEKSEIPMKPGALTHEQEAEPTKKKKREKLSKFEKRKIKKKKQEDLLNMRGIPKYFTIFIVETLYIFAVEMILKVLCGNLAIDFTMLRIFLSSAFISLLLTLITTNMPLKLRIGLLSFFDFIIAFYAWLQMGFLNFLGSFMSVGNAEQGTKALEYIIDFLGSYAPWIHLIYVPFILLIIYFTFERHITRDGFEKKIPFKSLIADLAVLVFGGILGLSYYATLELDFMQNKYQAISNKELFKKPSNAVVAIKNFGSTIYFVLDVKSTFINGGDSSYFSGSEVEGNGETEVTDYTRKIDDSAWESLIKVETDKDFITLNNYFINRKIVDKNEYTGIFEGKNLVMVMLESISEPLFHEEFKEYFPTFYKLYSEGITAENNYSPMNNCGTGESERTSQTSIYSIETTCTVNTYKQNEYQQALLYMFRKNGYYTSTYHDFDNRYYDRKTFEYKLGAMNYYNADDLGIKISSSYNEWPGDYEFMQKALPKFIEQEKFASYMITVTAHTPYIFDSEMGRKHIDLFKDTDYDITTKRYLSKVKEADLALEHLLSELEESGKLEDTVIVIFGDHYPYALSEKNYQSIAQYDISVNNEVDRTPFIIYNSETEPQKITKYTSPIDYAPTILNLFGIEYDPRYYMGNDVFSDYTDYVLFQDNSWQNVNGFYSSSKGEFEPTGEESTLSDEDIIAINKEALTKREMSGLAIKKDYFTYLFKYFDAYEKLEEEKKKREEKDNESDKDSDKKDMEE